MLAEAPAPRNDVAQRVSWELSAQKGRQGIVELVDADTGTAYAWLAAGRFDPPVIAVPKVSPNSIAQRLTTATQLFRTLRLSNLETPMTKLRDDPQTEPEVRAMAASALLVVAGRNNTSLLRRPYSRRQHSRAMFESNSASHRRTELAGSPHRHQGRAPRFLAGISAGSRTAARRQQ
jgi:hypothetical protein